MRLLKLTLRDLFWLTAVVGISLGWCLDHDWEAGERITVRGIVIAATSDLVEVSIGSDDGLKLGSVLQIHRGKTSLGQITIKATTPDRAVGQLSTFHGNVRKGDDVNGKVIVFRDFTCGSP